MKRVTLLNPPAPERVSRDYYCGHVTKGDYYWPQIDMLVMSGQLNNRCELQVLDAVVEELTAAEANRRIDSFAPEVVISMTAAISWSSDIKFLAELKKRHDAQILVTGDFPRAVPDQVLTGHPVLDGVVLNFADNQIGDYVDGAATCGLKNIYLREDPKAQFVQNKRFSFPIPRHDLFPIKKYRIPQNKYHPFTLLVTDFGCPYKCSYCYMERVAPAKREPENVREELQFIHSLGIRELMIHDQSFGAIKKNALETCATLRSVSDRFSWCCEMRVDSVDEELLTAMKAAGCHLIMFGVETPNEEVLAKYDKHQTNLQAKSAFDMCRRLGIRTLAHFIVGLAGEDVQSSQRLIDFSIELDPDIASFNVARPSWNTSLRDEIVEHGWIINNGVEIANVNFFPVWESPQFPREQMWRMRNKAMRSFYLRPSYMVRQLARVRTLCQIQTLLREGWHMVKQCMKFQNGAAVQSNQPPSNVTEDRHAEAVL